MHCVVGLGNPGPKYDHTRHNVGFEAALLVAARAGMAPPRKWRSSLVTRGSIHGEDVLVALPQTYMNLSGNAVQALASFYRLEPAHIVVLHDELDFEPGVVRIKWSGGHGGNNGIRSIIEHLGRDFVRVRIGVGKPPSTSSGADYVLSRFDAASRVRIDEALVSVADAVDVIVRDGVEEAMNTFNRRT